MDKTNQKKEQIENARQNPSFSYGDYKQSDAVEQAQQKLSQQLSQKPGQYQNPWQTQLNDTIQKIMNREKFNYDLNGDALYQQYKDQYTTQGKLAMMDTMGQASAMTGGYGSSYGQMVGQQAYQGHLQGLNDRIPELYQLALSKYQMEGDDLAKQYSLLAEQDDRAYGRHRDELGDWQAERDYLTGRYDSERDYDYGKYADGRDFAYGQYSDDRAYAYQQERDAVADRQWQQTFDYGVERDKVADAQWQKSYDYGVEQDKVAREQALRELALKYEVDLDELMGQDKGDDDDDDESDDPVETEQPLTADEWYKRRSDYLHKNVYDWAAATFANYGDYMKAYLQYEG